jgi:hypothetical protein
MGGKVCAACLDRVEKDLTIVRDYLDSDQKGKTIEDIERRTGVPKEVVVHLLREGRISVEEPDGGAMRCELCGRLVATGRFCEMCKNKFVEKVDSLKLSAPEAKVKPETERRTKTKMHIAARTRGDGK